MKRRPSAKLGDWLAIGVSFWTSACLELPTAFPSRAEFATCWAGVFRLDRILASFSLEGSWMKGQASPVRQPAI